MNALLKLLWIPVVGIIGALFVTCESDISGSFNPNMPPETYLYLQSADTLNFTESIQTIYWDGRDPDGFVVGFFYTFAENPGEGDWEWTTSRSLTFPLKITRPDTIYKFQVKAVDNRGAEDPTPAVQLFPIKNSPPQISWTRISRLPDTTFTVANFNWSASDPDGDSTLAFFEYALDDTTQWRTINGRARSIVLNADSGLTQGPHAFFIRAVDIAGARSEVIRMPEDPATFWYVKQPRGRYLLIDDYLVETNTSGFPDAYYKQMLNNVLSGIGEDFTYWNIEKLFPESQVQFVETLKLFDRVIWYTDIITETDPHFIIAQIAIPEFRSRGGKLIYAVQFNTGFGSQGSPLEFSPVSALGKFYNFIPSNSQYYPDSSFAETFPLLPPLPQLKVSKFILGLIALQPKATSVPMYRYDDPALAEDPIFVMVGQNDNTGEYDFVFSGTPLHFLQANNNLDQLFEIIIVDLFGP